MREVEGEGWTSLCGLVTEYGEAARNGEYEHAWQRPAEVWKAVQRALDDHGAGTRSPTPASRPPTWLAPLVRERVHRLATTWSHDDGFRQVRRLELAQLVQLDPDDDYVLAAVGGIGGRFEKARAQSLRDDPELRERVVWRFFEVEGGGEVSLANIDKFTPVENGWQAAFQELVGDGTLPRGRVLDAALAALGRDFSAYRAGWFSRLVDALDPTAEELAARQPQLRDLLRSTNGATVSWALRGLKGLKPPLLDVAATVPALVPAAQSSGKTTALTAVKLAGALHRTAPDQGVEAVEVARAGLGHANADVQAAAATLLSALGAADELEASAADVAPRVRRELALQEPETADDGGTRSTRPAGSRALAPRPVVADGRDVTERVAALLEDASNAIEVELGLAAVAALPDGSALTALAKRARKVLERGPREGVVAGWLRGQLAHLVCAAAGEPVPPLGSAPGAAGFLSARVLEVEQALVTGQGPHRLLATPTSQDGWLDPATYAERAQTGTPLRLDHAQALLRLGPGADRGEESVSVRLTFRSSEHTWEDRSGTHRYTTWYWSYEAGADSASPSDEPTAVLSREGRPYGDFLEDYVPWLGLLRPHDTEWLAYTLGDPVLCGALRSEVQHDAVPALQALGGHPGRVGALTATVLAAGLSAARTEQRVAAVDAVLQLAERDSLSPELLAAGLRGFREPAQLKRWAGSIADLARSGGLGAYLAVHASYIALPSLTQDRRGMSDLLGVVLDTAIELGAAPDDPVRRWLQGFSGTSQAARTASRLAAL